MVGEVFAGLSAFKTMFDMAKALKDINDATIRNAAVIELQEKILGAQETQATLAQSVRDLEEEVAQLKNWETEKTRYQMKDLGTGAIAYVIKAHMQCAEPAHCICANCYEHGKKGFLRNTYKGSAVYLFGWECSECGRAIQVPNSFAPTAV